MKKKVIFGVVIVFALAVFVSLVVKQYEIDAEAKKDYIIAQSTSPDGCHTVAVIGNGEPQWSFGCQQISIQFDSNQNLITTTIGNDGREADVQSINWDQNTVSLEIAGRNTPCQQYVITFNSDDITISISK